MVPYCVIENKLYVLVQTKKKIFFSFPKKCQKQIEFTEKSINWRTTKYKTSFFLSFGVQQKESLYYAKVKIEFKKEKKRKQKQENFIVIIIHCPFSLNHNYLYDHDLS